MFVPASILAPKSMLSLVLVSLQRGERGVKVTVLRSLVGMYMCHCCGAVWERCSPLIVQKLFCMCACMCACACVMVVRVGDCGWVCAIDISLTVLV